MPDPKMITAAKVAAAVLTGSWAALIAAAPGNADVYSQCRALPAEDLCHLIWNVPADPSIPHYPPDPYDPYADPSNSLSPLYPQTPASTPQPIIPAAPPPTFSPDPFNPNSH